MEISSSFLARSAFDDSGLMSGYNSIEYISGPGGFLTARDVDMLRTATGVDFNWPPDDETGAPMAAAELASFRHREMLAGSMLGEFTARDIHVLRRLGILDPETASKAIEHLRTTARENTTTDQRTTPRDEPGVTYL